MATKDQVVNAVKFALYTVPDGVQNARNLSWFWHNHAEDQTTLADLKAKTLMESDE